MVTYDEAKREANLAKHGFDFVGDEEIFTGFTITREDQSQRYGELRLQTLGIWNGVGGVRGSHPARRRRSRYIHSQSGKA